MPSEVKWYGTERDIVLVDGYTYCADYLDESIAEKGAALNRMERAKAFVVAEAERARWDCAGERAFIANLAGDRHVLSWDEIVPDRRAHWTSVARAVIEGESV